MPSSHAQIHMGSMWAFPIMKRRGLVGATGTTRQCRDGHPGGRRRALR